ncbi:MAG: hypothetical protein ACYC35_08945 [Pirellulales bacterium]
MSREKRRQLFVDSKVQGSLLLRVVAYWFYCLLTITLMVLCWRVVTGPARPFYTHFDDMWFHFGPALVASLLLLPLVVIDCVRLSSRFAGPMVRLRNAMHRLAQGEQVQPVHFRKGDFWQEFAEDFNQVLSRLQRSDQDLAPDHEKSPTRS